jgi:hypothetical protein
MSLVLYYSNYCENSRGILRSLSKSELKNEIHFICVDKRFRDNQSGATYVVLENQQKILLPPQVTKVPAMLLLKEGNAVIFGKEIESRLKPQTDYRNAAATGFNGEPLAFSLGSDHTGCFGVASDTFSYWDQGSDELLAKGDGGLRQMYNYATVEHTSKIETPPDNWTPDKVGETAMQDMEAQRNKDLQMQQVNKQIINK